MPEESHSTDVDRELATKIVAAYVRRNQIGADQIGTLISTVHQALAGVGKPAEEQLTPAVPIRRSVQHDRVICLECGWAGKMLRRHISGHRMSADEYRRRWSLSAEHPLVAPAYAEVRSAFAKQVGLGRRGRGRPAKGVAAEISAEAATPKKSRSRSRRGRRRQKAEVQASAET